MMYGNPIVAIFFMFAFVVIRGSVDARVFDSGRISRAVRAATSSWQSDSYPEFDGLEIDEIKQSYLGVLEDSVEDSVKKSPDNVARFFSGNSSFDWRDTNQSVCIGPIKVCP